MAKNLSRVPKSNSRTLNLAHRAFFIMVVNLYEDIAASSRASRHDVAYSAAVNIRQSEIATCVAIGEPFMIQA